MEQRLYNITTDANGELLAITYVVMVNSMPTEVKELNLNTLTPEEIEQIKSTCTLIRTK